MQVLRRLSESPLVLSSVRVMSRRYLKKLGSSSIALDEPEDDEDELEDEQVGTGPHRDQHPPHYIICDSSSVASSILASACLAAAIIRVRLRSLSISFSVV
jgi:hypothetical protein